MSLENPPVLKVKDQSEPHHVAAPPEHDPLQAYRLERSSLAQSKPTTEKYLDVNDLWKPSIDAPLNFSGKQTALDAPQKSILIKPEDMAMRANDSAGAPVDGAAKPQVAGVGTDLPSKIHTVAANENLWNIALDSLKAKGEKDPSGPEIWKSVQSIIAANKTEHPELVKNPDAVAEGTKLNMPGDEKAAQATAPGEASQEASREASLASSKSPLESADAPADTPPGAPEEGSHRAARVHHRRHHAPEGGTEHHGGHDRAPEHGRHHGRRHGLGGRGGGSKRGHRRRKGHDVTHSRSKRREDSETEGPDTEKTKAAREIRPDERDNPADMSRPGLRLDKNGNVVEKPDEHDNPFSHAFKELGKGLGDLAHHMAGLIHTVGDCAKGPRLTFQKLGYVLPPMVATEQGRALERSGLFEEVPRSEARAGDYAYRHWNSKVIRQHHGVDKGDAFIVSGVGKGGELYGSNDHRFVVPEDGGRYRDTKFLRPTEKFWELYGQKS